MIFASLGLGFVLEMVKGITSDRKSFRTPEQMSENRTEYDVTPWYYIGGLVLGLIAVVLLKKVFTKKES